MGALLLPPSNQLRTAFGADLPLYIRLSNAISSVDVTPAKRRDKEKYPCRDNPTSQR
jgi:hypothetical protein